jgi:hypothetical protein
MGGQERLYGYRKIFRVDEEAGFEKEGKKGRVGELQKVL